MKFTVVMPVYNGERFVAEAIQSVLRQTYKDWELLIINDGSTDDTERIALNSIEKSKRANIRLINQENKGLGAARNTGIKNSNGEYIALLDADDIWYEKKLETICNVLNRMKDVEIVCHNEYLVKRDTGFKRKLCYGPEKMCGYHDLLFRGNVLSGSATTIRKDKLFEANLFSEDRQWHGVEDYDMWLKLARIGAKFFFLDEIHGEYVLHDGNMTNDFDAFNTRVINVIRYHFERLPRRTFFHEYLFNRRKAKIYQDTAVGLLKNKRFFSAWKQLIKSLKV